MSTKAFLSCAVASVAAVAQANGMPMPVHEYVSTSTRLPLCINHNFTRVRKIATRMNKKTVNGEFCISECISVVEVIYGLVAPCPTENFCDDIYGSPPECGGNIEAKPVTQVACGSSDGWPTHNQNTLTDWALAMEDYEECLRTNFLCQMQGCYAGCYDRKHAFKGDLVALEPWCESVWSGIRMVVEARTS